MEDALSGPTGGWFLPELIVVCTAHLPAGFQQVQDASGTTAAFQLVVARGILLVLLRGVVLLGMKCVQRRQTASHSVLKGGRAFYPQQRLIFLLFGHVTQWHRPQETKAGTLALATCSPSAPV